MRKAAGVKRLSSFDLSLALSLAAVLGLVLASAGLWLGGGRLGSLVTPGLVLVYLTGGLPAASRALGALWNERVLDMTC